MQCTLKIVQCCLRCRRRTGQGSLRSAAVGSQHVQGAETRQKLLKRGSDKLSAAQRAVLQEEATALARDNIMPL